MADLAQTHKIDLSVLFLTYNRADLLEITYRSIRERMDFGSLRVEYIVADDGSDPAHVQLHQQLHFDQRVLWPTNTGLGANSNRGIAAARGEYILQIQDDCEFVGPLGLLGTGLDIMRSDSDVGTIQLTNQTAGVPHEVRHTPNGTPYWVFTNDGLPHPRECGERPYSDQPHLKRKRFAEDVGPYAEGVPMTVMEIGYQQRVANQSRWKVAYLPQDWSFCHIGAHRTFNDSLLRAKRLDALERRPVVGAAFRRSRPHLRTLKRLLRAVRSE